MANEVDVIPANAPANVDPTGKDGNKQVVTPPGPQENSNSPANPDPTKIIPPQTDVEVIKEEEAAKAKLAEETAKKETEAKAAADKVAAEAKAKTDAEAKVKADADAKAKAEAEAKNVSAEKLKLPENSLISKTRLSEIADQAKKDNLTLEQAQALVEREHAVADRIRIEGAGRLKAQGEKWQAELKADKELGGNQYNETTKLVKQVVVAALGNDEGEKFLQDAKALGVDQHPSFNRILARLGRSMNPSDLVLGETRGNSPAQDNVKPWEKIYDYGPDRPYDPFKVVAQTSAEVRMNQK